MTRSKGVSYIVDEDCDGAADYEVMVGPTTNASRSLCSTTTTATVGSTP